MKHAKLFFVLLVACLLPAFALIGCGCGDDDDNDDEVNDDTVSPDDDANDDVDDDVNDDVDDDVNDDVNDDVDDDTGPYDPPEWYPKLPDPEGIGDGLLIGGGPIMDLIKVYTFDDATGELLGGCTVYYKGVAYDETSTGYFEITPDEAGEALVTAYKFGYVNWGYQVNAKVMYFRMRPWGHDRICTDSVDGHHKLDGETLDLDNPQVASILDILNLFNEPIYLGAAFPGVSRKTFVSTDLRCLLTQGTFDVTYGITEAKAEETAPLPNNLYIPDVDVQLDLTGVGGLSFNAAHDMYNVPAMEGIADSPLETFIMQIDLGSAFTWDTIMGWLQDPPDDLAVLILETIPVLMQNGMSFPYIGTMPSWDGVSAPDMNVRQVDGAEVIPMTITEPLEWWHYMALTLAEIPNRATLPVGFGFLPGEGTGDREGEAEIATVPGADYITVLIKNDLYNLNNASFSLKYADDWSEWSDGIDYNNRTDFLPLFNGWSNCWDTDTGAITWSFHDVDVSDLTVDAYLAVIGPANADAIVALLPGDSTEFTYPMPATFTDEDIVAIFGFDLPDGVEITEFNPYEILTYDIKSFNVWTNMDLLTILIELMGGLVGPEL